MFSRWRWHHLHQQSFTTLCTSSVTSKRHALPAVAPPVLRRPRYCNHIVVPVSVIRFPLTCLNNQLHTLSPHAVRHFVCQSTSFNVLTSSGHRLPNQSYLIDRINPIDQLQPCLLTRYHRHLPTFKSIISSLSLRSLPDQLHQLWLHSCAPP